MHISCTCQSRVSTPAESQQQHCYSICVTDVTLCIKHQQLKLHIERGRERETTGWGKVGPQDGRLESALNKEHAKRGEWHGGRSSQSSAVRSMTPGLTSRLLLSAGQYSRSAEAAAAPAPAIAGGGAGAAGAGSSSKAVPSAGCRTPRTQLAGTGAAPAGQGANGGWAAEAAAASVSQASPSPSSTSAASPTVVGRVLASKCRAPGEAAPSLLLAAAVSRLSPPPPPSVVVARRASRWPAPKRAWPASFAPDIKPPTPPRSPPPPPPPPPMGESRRDGSPPARRLATAAVPSAAAAGG